MSNKNTSAIRFGDLPVKTVFFSDGDWLWKSSAFFATEINIDEMVVLDDLEMVEDDICISVGLANTEQEIETLILTALL